MLSFVDMASTSLYAAIQVSVLLLNHITVYNHFFYMFCYYTTQFLLTLINHMKIHFYKEMPFLRMFTL